MKIIIDNEEAKGVVEIIPAGYGVEVYVDGIFQCLVDLFYNNPKTVMYKKIRRPLVDMGAGSENSFIRIIPQNIPEEEKEN